MAGRRFSRLVAAVLAATLVLGAAPAFAEPAEPTVVAHVTVAGTALDLFGMTAVEAHDAIAAACVKPNLAPLQAVAAGAGFTLDVAASVALDVDTMVAGALAATDAVELAPRWAADPAGVSAFVTRVASAAYRAPVNARRTIVNKRLRLVAQVEGAALDTAAATSAVTGAIAAELADGGTARPTLTLAMAAVGAPVTTGNIGKTIVVVLHERYVYLYNGAKQEKKYRCAIGMKRYPTPLGTFKVIKKNPHPTWGNPYSAWSRKMPRFIKAGYYNPLGLRALYINSPGIRIHGTSKTSSMGRAASHGCIRLTNKNIVNLYPRVAVGTPVYIVK